MSIPWESVGDCKIQAGLPVPVFNPSYNKMGPPRQTMKQTDSQVIKIIHLHLVEWAIATHGMYESPFCVGNVHSLSYFQFQGIDGLYVSYKQFH